jgi:hypothetical protein
LVRVPGGEEAGLGLSALAGAFLTPGSGISFFLIPNPLSKPPAHPHCNADASNPTHKRTSIEMSPKSIFI